MIRKTSLAVGFAAALTAAPALAADWRLVTVDEDIGEDNGRSVAGFVDYETLSRNGPSVTFSLMFVTEQTSRSGMDRATARI